MPGQLRALTLTRGQSCHNESMTTWGHKRGLLKVSEFSGLGRVTVKALHLYDRLRLLPPARVDAATGYRLYSLDQLPRLNRILALKDLGFSLDEIGKMMDEEPSTAEMRGMLRLKRIELEREVTKGRERLARVDARLRQIEREGIPSPYDVTLKEVRPMTIASTRGVVPSVASMVRRTYEVARLVRASGVRVTGPTLAIFYHQGFREVDLDVELAVPVATGVVLDIRTSEGGHVRVRELKQQICVASVIWRGDGGPLIEAYAAIGSWIAETDYRVAGPAREIYLRDGDASKKVFEIQYPVEDA